MGCSFSLGVSHHFASVDVIILVVLCTRSCYLTLKFTETSTPWYCRYRDLCNYQLALAPHSPTNLGPRFKTINSNPKPALYQVLYQSVHSTATDRPSHGTRPNGKNCAITLKGEWLQTQDLEFGRFFIVRRISN